MPVPAWVASQTIGTWAQIPGTNISSVDPSPLPTGNEGAIAKITSWTSFVCDIRTSEIYCVGNGGHAAYYGNEGDVLKLNQSSPAWSQVSAPTAAANIISCAEYYADGKPTAKHTYYGVTLDIANNRIMFFGGVWSCSNGTPYLDTVDSYKLDSFTYNAAGSHPLLIAPFNQFGVSYVADPTNGDVHMISGHSHSKWDRATNTIAAVTPSSGTAPWGYAGTAYDTTRNKIFSLGGENNDQDIYDKAANAWTRISTSGALAADFAFAPQIALVYVKALDRYLARKDAAGGMVYAIHPSTFAVSDYGATGGSGIPVTLNGPYNKFLYVPKLGGCVYCPEYTTNAWFLKLHDVSFGVVSGTVDSSLVDRHNAALNAVYVFGGSSVTTGPVLATAAITQTFATCMFGFVMPELAYADYTFAVTRDGGATFNSTANVTIAAGTQTQNFAAASIIQVGPARTYTNPNAVVGVVNHGDVVEIDAGTYTGIDSVWTKNRLTFRGVGGIAHMVAASPITNLKAMFVTQGSDNRFEHVEFSGAAVPDHNGCGIRVEGADLALCHTNFHDNEGGILGNDGAGYILIEFSQFDTEGNCIDPAACSHHIYLGHNTRTIVQFSKFTNGFEGHLIKSRSLETRILYNYLMDEVTGASSYQINLTNGGLAYVIGNVIQKGINSQNSGAMITYGENGLTNANKQLYVINNTLVNDLGSNLVVYIQVQSGANNAVIENNLFVGNRTIASGPNTQTTNIQTLTPNFVDRAGFNYRPTSTTPGINGGTAPGTGSGLDLTPLYHYLATASQENRPVIDALDIGAYEFLAALGSNNAMAIHCDNIC